MKRQDAWNTLDELNRRVAAHTHRLQKSRTVFPDVQIFLEETISTYR
jgi:hypothetical protein